MGCGHLWPLDVPTFGLASLMLRYDVLQVIDGYLLVGELVALRPKGLARKDLGREVVRRAVATTELSSATRPQCGSWPNSSSTSSRTAFTATGFLLMLPTETQRRGAVRHLFF